MGDSSLIGDERTTASAGPERWWLALEAGGVGVWEWDPALDALRWSPRAGTIVGLDAGTVSGTVEGFLQRVHPDDRAVVREALDTGRHSREPIHFEFRLSHPDVQWRWVRCSAMAVTDSPGVPRVVVGTLVDVNDRKEAELAREREFFEERRARAEAEAARERLQFLVSASREVRVVLDPEVVRRIAVELVVRHLGEWSLILDPAGTTVAAGTGGGLTSAAFSRGPLVVSSDEAISRVVATGTPQLVAGPATLSLVGAGETPVHSLDASSIAVVPLALGSNRVGILVAGHSDTGRPYQAEELELFGQFAESLAATLVKATLFAERSAIAEALQRSLLPATLPEIDGVEVGTAYVPVGDGLIVGGDFFDVFRISDRRYAFAIGDVSGKGSEAAAVTSLVRHSIRAYAEVHEDPADVLVAVNDSVRLHGPAHRYCTAVFGVLTVGDRVEASVAVGGHPLPVVVHPDGSTETVGTPGTLLGMFADVRIANRRVTLDPGDSLVLYTDGVIEARSGGASYGEERLRSLLKTISEEAPDTMAAAIGAAVVDFRDTQTDDLAVVVLRRSNE